jgi:hypothetical protein
MKPSLPLALSLSLLIGLPLTYGPALAQVQPTPSPQAAAPRVQPTLGLYVKPLPPPLASQLPDGVAIGQGLLVAQLVPDSPAAEAGVEQYDVLLTYGDQKLFSPQQLIKLVLADKPGNSVALTLLHRGTVSTVNVTLGEQPVPIAEQPRTPMQRMSQWWQWMHTPPVEPQRSPAAPLQRPGQPHRPMAWERLEQLSMKRLEDGRYQLELSYQETGGETRHRSYEGTPPEIRSHILQERDLPAHERNLMLKALDAQFAPRPRDEDQWPSGFPSFPFDMGSFFNRR